MIRLSDGRLEVHGLHKGVPIYTAPELEPTSRPYPLSVAQMIVRAATDDEIRDLVKRLDSTPMKEGTRRKLRRLASARLEMFRIQGDAIMARAAQQAASR